MAEIEQPFFDGEDEPDQELNRITNAVIGAAIEVHRHLGPGHLEAAYQRSMEIELTRRGVSHQRQAPVTLCYKGEVVGEGLLDLLVCGKVIVELKAVEAIPPQFVAKMISYLRMTGLRLGLILNFNAAQLRHGIKRIAL